MGKLQTPETEGLWPECWHRLKAFWLVALIKSWLCSRWMLRCDIQSRGWISQESPLGLIRSFIFTKNVFFKLKTYNSSVFFGHTIKVCSHVAMKEVNTCFSHRESVPEGWPMHVCVLMITGEQMLSEAGTWHLCPGKRERSWTLRSHRRSELSAASSISSRL